MRVLLSEGAGLTSRQVAGQLGSLGHEVEIPSSSKLCLTRFTRHVRAVYEVPRFGLDPFGWLAAAERIAGQRKADLLFPTQEQVTVLSVEGGTTPGPSGEMAALHLRRNGINATALTVKPGTRTTGEAILDQATSMGCDLLVKSAYTQSRLSQMIFGGATRHILANATLPVLMAH